MFENQMLPNLKLLSGRLFKTVQDNHRKMYENSISKILQSANVLKRIEESQWVHSQKIGCPVDLMFELII